MNETERARYERLRHATELALDRYYEEGYWEWPKAKFAGLLTPDLDLGNPEVERWLREWEAEGRVRLPRDDDRYLVMIRPFVGDPLY